MSVIAVRSKRIRLKLVVLAAVFVGIAPATFSLSTVVGYGDWPDSWPEELDALRTESNTAQSMSMVVEDVHEIPFRDRGQFERLWPTLLGIKSPGAPVRLKSARLEPDGAVERYVRPYVRIYAPPGYGSVTTGRETKAALAAVVRQMDGASPEEMKKLDAEVHEIVSMSHETNDVLLPGPPWPAVIMGEDGKLPEYVCVDEIDGKRTWVPETPIAERRSLLFRARIEIELVVDGEVIDLNRIALPAECPVIDTRTEKKVGN